MSNFIDLDVLVPEPLNFKFKEETYTVPTQPPVEEIIKFTSFQLKLNKAKEPDKQVELMADTVAFILDLDDSKSVNSAFVKANLSFQQMKTIIEAFANKVRETATNPN